MGCRVVQQWGVCGIDTVESTVIGKSRGCKGFLHAVLCRFATFVKEVCRELKVVSRL